MKRRNWFERLANKLGGGQQGARRKARNWQQQARTRQTETARLAYEATFESQAPEVGAAGEEMRLVNAYTVNPADIEAGDVMLFVVKAMVVRPGVYRLYRCPFKDYLSEETPQGSRIGGDEREVCEALFPSLAEVAEPDTF